MCFPRQATPRYWARSAPRPCSSRPRTVGSGARCAIIGCSPIHACCLGVRSSYRVPRHFHRLFTGSQQGAWPAYRALCRRSGSATRRSRSTGWSGSTGPVNSSSPLRGCSLPFLSLAFGIHFGGFHRVRDASESIGHARAKRVDWDDDRNRKCPPIRRDATKAFRHDRRASRGSGAARVCRLVRNSCSRRPRC